jgi:hypothetical protein
MHERDILSHFRDIVSNRATVSTPLRFQHFSVSVMNSSYFRFDLFVLEQP